MLEKFQDIPELYKIIVFETGKTEDEIAASLGYSRSHFNRVMKNRSEKVNAGLLDLIKKTYEKEIAQFVLRYSNPNLIGRETELRVLAESQVALMKIVLVMASEKKSVYNKSVEILKRHNLEGIFL